jgi:putative oxidoreductase
MFIFRIFLGLSMLFAHGLPKLKNFDQLSQSFPDPLGISSPISLSLVIFSEVVCSILLTLGIKIRWVLIPLIVTMGVAAFVIHFDDPYAKKEKALLYLFGYLTLFFLIKTKNADDDY